MLQKLIKIFEGQIKEAIPKESFGFVIGGDVQEDKLTDERPMEEKKPKIKWQLPKLPNLPVFNLKFSLKGKTAAVLGVVIIGLSFILNEYFFHQAQLTVYLPSQQIKKTIEESLDYKVASLSADFSEDILTSGKKEILFGGQPFLIPYLDKALVLEAANGLQLGLSH